MQAVDGMCGECGEPAVKHGRCRRCLELRKEQLVNEIRELRMTLTQKQDELDQLA
jgi:hypothetical protein